jgi:DtxR family Mn-dependent transcriptional regulator
MDSDRPSGSIEDYLKAIYGIQEREEGDVTTSRLAERLGVLNSSVSGMVRKLRDSGLAEHRPYGEITLTDEGRAAALEVVRRHRLLETFLVRELDYTWDEVHEDAEVLEHAVSDRLVARIAEKLGHPKVDPHGDPIPADDGSVPKVAAERMSRMEPGTRGTLVRVDDADSALLRHITDLGIKLGAKVEVLERKPFDGPFVIRIGHKAHELAPAVAEALWVRHA